ncbi:hypothetical protein [Moraxella caprae]|nr:hypothetical protein [Moraxella caprae]
MNKNGEIICGARLSNILVNVRVTDGTGIIENTKTKEKKNLQKNDTFKLC